jgi:Ca2+ transporting ATPase
MDSAWTLSAEQVVKKLATDEHHGLDSAQVSKRQSKYGSNGNSCLVSFCFKAIRDSLDDCNGMCTEIPEEPPTPLWELVLEQFKDQLVIILLLAAVVSLVLAFLETDEKEKSTAFVEPVVILLILIANAVVGVVQESNAEKAIEVCLSLVHLDTRAT